MRSMAAQRRPGPNAIFVAHTAVGIAGSAALCALFKSQSVGGQFIAWVVGFTLAVWLHRKLDAPVAKMIASITPALG